MTVLNQRMHEGLLGSSMAARGVSFAIVFAEALEKHDAALEEELQALEKKSGEGMHLPRCC